MFEANPDIIILFVVLVIAYIRPVALTNLFNSNLGRLLLIICIVLATSINTIYGLYGVLLLISFREGAKKEGLENMEDNDENDEDSDSDDEDSDNEDSDDEDSDTEDDGNEKKNENGNGKKKNGKKNGNNKKKVKEGLTNMNVNMGANMSADDWKKKYCKSGKVFLDNKEVPSEEFAKKFPNVKFDNGQCNPCSNGCLFKVTSSGARLDVEDKVRAKPSGTLPSDK